MFLFVLDNNLFSPIFRPSDVPGVDEDSGSPLRLTVGAARIVSCAQSLQGPFDVSFLVDEEEDDFDGPTVGVVVADLLDTVVADLTEDMVGVITVGEAKAVCVRVEIV